jgi:L-aminopeptidase/D-esterase-like protein
MGRLGSYAGNSSGDLFLAFSTANAGAAKPDGTPSLNMLPNERIDPLFRATIEATEEAVVNAMLAAQTMTARTASASLAYPAIASSRFCGSTTE